MRVADLGRILGRLGARVAAGLALNYNSPMPCRPVIRALSVGGLTTILVALVLGTDRVFYCVQEVVAWLTPRAIPDQAAWLIADGLTVLTLAAPGLVVAVVIAVRGAVPRHPPGRCQRCGYDLTGNMSGVCPECGASG